MSIATASPRPRPAAREEFPHLAGVLVRAFDRDPFHRWLFPDDRLRPRRQKVLFERVLEISKRHGVVSTTNEGSGVAMWDPPRDHGPRLAEVLYFLFRVLPVFGARAMAVAKGMAPMAALHPDEPHWYLSVLGTDPAHQRRGVGAALLQPVLAQCDRDRTAAYLEASRVENVPYYERFGFEVVAPLAMPGAGPVIYRMKREPQ